MPQRLEDLSDRLRIWTDHEKEVMNVFMDERDKTLSAAVNVLRE